MLVMKNKDFNNFAKEISTLSLDDFKKSIDILTSNPTNKIDKKVYNLLNKVQSTTATIQGSRASLKLRRNEMRAYIIYYGVPDFYVTINPVDVHNPLILKLGNVDVTPEWLSKDFNNKRALFIKKNPVLQSIYYNIIIESFIKFILNYDKNCNNNQNVGILGNIIKAKLIAFNIILNYLILI